MIAICAALLVAAASFTAKARIGVARETLFLEMTNAATPVTPLRSFPTQAPPITIWRPLSDAAPM